MTFSQSWLEESRVATNLFVAVTIKSSWKNNTTTKTLNQ